MRLSAPERRVLGCLIEKERATPQGYPLTLNALRSACNQSTNRDPIVDYDDRIIEEALVELRQHGLTRIVYSTSNRAAKYRHIADDHLHLGDDELSVLAVLLLRGPQTVGEIKGRTERLFAFANLQAVQTTLERMADRSEDPLVVRFARRPGQKDARWGDLLGGPVEHRDGEAVEPEPAWSVDGSVSAGTPGPGRPSDGRSPQAGAGVEAAAFADLAAEVAELRGHLATLRAEFDAFRSAFG